MAPIWRETIASYNWCAAKSTRRNPRIIVPGIPREYIGTKHQSFRVQRDDENTFSGYTEDEYARQTPCGSMEALLHALQSCSPDFDAHDVDMMVDRVSLLDILSFCGSPGRRSEDRRLIQRLVERPLL